MSSRTSLKSRNFDSEFRLRVFRKRSKFDSHPNFFIMSSVLRLSTTVDQSRPTHSRETKNFGTLLRRLTIKRGSRGANSTNADENSNMATTANTTATRKLSSSRSFRRRHVPQSGPVDAVTLMNWLQNDCPQDLVPRVLAFAGPQTTAALSHTCRFWKEMTEKESTWRTLCEEMYKVCSWKLLIELLGHDLFLTVMCHCSGKKETKFRNPGATFTNSTRVFLSTFQQSMGPFLLSKVLAVSRFGRFGFCSVLAAML